MPRHGFPTETQELLVKAALAEDRGSALEAWTAWKQRDSLERTDHDSGRLFPLLCRNLLRLGIDDPGLPVLKSAYRHQWVSNQQRLERAGDALRTLAASGIETMVLKGAALTEGYYGDVGVRPMQDVDVLVPGERAQDAADALARGGWSASLDVPLDVLLPIVNGTLYADEAGGRVDLHWHALWSPADEGDFWTHAEPLVVGRAQTRAQCPADQLLQVCVHGIWSDGHRLRWIPDAMVVLARRPGLDWDRLVERARARALTLPLLQALAYLEQTFGAAIPASAMAALRGSDHGSWERIGHAAWNARQTKLRTAALLWEHYRRHRALPPGPSRCGSPLAYLRRHASLRAALRSLADPG